VRLNLHGHLVGGSTDAARANLEGRTNVVERLLQDDDGFLAALRSNAFECTVHDALGEALLTLNKDLVHELGNNGCPVDGVGNNGTLRSGTFTRHYFFSFFAP
jgi:hypothetical protein